MLDFPMVVQFSLKSRAEWTLVTVQKFRGVFALNVCLEIFSPSCLEVTLRTTHLLSLVLCLCVLFQPYLALCFVITLFTHKHHIRMDCVHMLLHPRLCGECFATPIAGKDHSLVSMQLVIF